MKRWNFILAVTGMLMFASSALSADKIEVYVDNETKDKVVNVMCGNLWGEFSGLVQPAKKQQLLPFGDQPSRVLSAHTAGEAMHCIVYNLDKKEIARLDTRMMVLKNDLAERAKINIIFKEDGTLFYAGTQYE